MSKTVKFTITDEQSEELKEMAGDISIQDFLRKKLFDDSKSFDFFKIQEKAKSMYKKGETFTLPDLIEMNEMSGIYGRKFKEQVLSGNTEIELVKVHKCICIYKLK